MSYRMMPPGSYHFWRIGMLSPLIRWVLTASACCVLIMVWYLLTTRLLFRTTSDQQWCVQCTAQLAELAHADEVGEINAAQNAEHPSLVLLNLCEQHGLTVQSSTSQKPTIKNSLSLQRVNITCTGSLAQFQAFLAALSTQLISISNLELHLSEHQRSYRGTLTVDFIRTCL